MPALALAILLVYLAPLVFMGQDAYVLIHDNLDSNLVWYKVLASSGLIFAPSDTIIPNFLGGIPRSAFPSEWNLQLWLYVAFEPYTASVINQFVIRGVALAGMFLLLRDHVLEPFGDNTTLVSVGTALAFSLLPFWPSGGLSIAGQPLAAYALLSIRKNGGNPLSWFTIALLPFYSYLVFASIFFLASFGIFAVVDALRRRRIDWPLPLALGVSGLLHGLVEYRLLLSRARGGAFVSHRTEFVPTLTEAGAAFHEAFDLIWEGQYHAASGHMPVIIVSVALAFLLAYRRREVPRPLIVSVGAICAIAAFFGAYGWQGFASIRTGLSLGVGFAADRFYTLLPLLWHIAFAISLIILVRTQRLGQRYVRALLALQVSAMFLASDFSQEFLGAGISYKRFYAAEQFESVQREIGRAQSSYRVASLGLHPSIAQYNGFHTADGYFPNYPLSHKHSLRRLIRRELAKNPSLTRYFDTWGSRAYVFSAEIGRNYLNAGEEIQAVQDLQLDPEAMRELGIDYILSAIPIENPDRNALRLRKRFSHADSAWDIYLYESIQPQPSAEMATRSARTKIAASLLNHSDKEERDSRTQ